MINLPFNPFECELAELEPQNLSVLRSVAEGWYIEYKRELVDTKKIAKSLAAFANHYGGWLFYGIAESTDGSNLAELFPGIAKNEIPACLDNIRNAAKDCVTPPPYYDYRVIDGPCSDIGLSDDRSIIVVMIPSGPDAPYIHSDGRIYRRIADSSDPKPETDRFTLDMLWQRRQNAHRKFRSFIRKRPQLSKEEQDKSFLHVFLSTDPSNLRDQQFELSFDRFKQLMSDPAVNHLQFSIPFDNFFMSSDGLVCRQIGTSDPFYLLPTFNFNFDASAYISIPLSSMPAFAIGEAESTDTSPVHNYVHAFEFAKMLESHRYRFVEILDINNLLFILSSVIGHYKRILEELGLDGEIYAKALLENIWRKIPFLDTKSYLTHISAHGFPLIQSDESFAPPGDTLDSLRVIAENQPTNNPGWSPAFQQLQDAAPLVGDIARALGLPISVMFDSEGEWMNAVTRSISGVKTTNKNTA